AEEQEEARMLPIRLAELPERAADGVEPGGRHVDRAEAAMRGVVRRPELARPPSGERLRLIAAGEEGEATRVAVADGAEPRRGRRHRLVPFDLAELAAAARPDAHERLGQARRRVMLHDPRRALGAEHAAIDGMRAVSLDVADAAVAEMHFDAAAAGAHVAGGEGDTVAGRLLRRCFRLCESAAAGSGSSHVV